MSKKQWIGFAILVLMVAAVELLAHFTKRWADCQPHPELLVFQPEREEQFLQYLDSLRAAEYAARRSQYECTPKPVIHLQPFDPNTADSTLLVTVGLKPWMAHNLLRYRQAGKVFHRPDNLRSLYGMTDSLYATLTPYIRIDTLVADSLSWLSWGQTGGKPEAKADSSLFSYHPKRDTILELNTADTADLQLLRGIGRYTAIRIVRYRQALGGYYSVNQLYEIKELPAERVDSLIPHFFADTSLITPLDVNRATVKQLYRHPYISYSQAELLYDLRRRQVGIRSMDELRSLNARAGIFTRDELQRLAPYIRFGEQ